MIDKICHCGHLEKDHIDKKNNFMSRYNNVPVDFFIRCGKCFELGITSDMEAHWHPFKQDNLKTLEKAYEISK